MATAKAQMKNRASATEQAGGGTARDHPSPECLTCEGSQPWGKGRSDFPVLLREMETDDYQDLRVSH